MIKVEDPAQAVMSGVVWKEIKSYIIQTRGQGKLTQLLSVASPILKKYFNKKVLVTTTSNSKLLADFHLAWKIAWPDQNGEAFDTMMKWVAKKNLDSMMTVFMIAATPHIMAMNFPRMWNSFFNYGQLIIRKDFGKSITFEVMGTDVYGEFACVLIKGLTEEAIQEVGGKHVTVLHDECRHSNHARCIFTIEWE